MPFNQKRIFSCFLPLIFIRATHGTKWMTREEITDWYGEKSLWPEINSLKENPSQQCKTEFVHYGLCNVIWKFLILLLSSSWLHKFPIMLKGQTTMWWKISWCQEFEESQFFQKNINIGMAVTFPIPSIYYWYPFNTYLLTAINALSFKYV